MSLIQFEGLTMFYTHEKNDMSNQNNIVNDCIFICRKDYTSGNQKPEWCVLVLCPIRIILWMIVFSYVGKIIHPIKSQSDACLQPPLLCKLFCSEFNQEICWVWDVKESLSERKLTSEKESRNWNRIALYNLFHSHWWEKNCRTTAGRMENYQLVLCFS